MKDTLQKLRKLRDMQPRPHPSDGNHLKNYLICLENNRLDSYYKTHKPGLHQVFNEEII